MNVIHSILLAIILFSVQVAYAYLHRIHSESQFYRTINKRSIAITFFYQEDKDIRKDTYCKSKICSSLSALERMSRLPWYNDGDCIFVIVNVATDELCELVRTLGIAKLPAYILCYNSFPVRDVHDQPAILQGFASGNQLESYIDRYVGGTIEDNIHDRAEQRRVAREEARLRYEYYAPYFYWGYPYWGYGPGFGFGFGNYY